MSGPVVPPTPQPEKPDPVNWIGQAIVVLVIGAYLVAIAWAGVQTLFVKGVPELPPGILAILTVFGGALGTVFGATIGISKQTTNTLLPPTPRMLMRGIKVPAWDGYVWATIAYFVGMCLTVVLLGLIWIVNRDGIPPILSSMGASVLGTAGAVFALRAAPPKR